MQYKISGFWRRVGTLFIDAFILGVFGLLLGLLFSQQFVGLGGWGRAIGFPIAAVYFGILNSRKVMWGQALTIAECVQHITGKIMDSALYL
jgi:hypothetical protein